MGKIVDDRTIPMRGGMNTALEKALIPFGGYSEINNFIPMRSGFKQRKGQKEQATTADASLETITHHQFTKGLRTERHLYAQKIDGSLQEATDNPPAVTSGTFGSDVLSAIANPLPASSAIVKDTFFYSDGVRQHQVYGGSQGKIKAFIVIEETGVLTGSISAFTVYGNDSKVTSTAHGLSEDDVVTISGTTSYNGVFDVNVVIDSDNFSIGATWVADDATGTWLTYPVPATTAVIPTKGKEYRLKVSDGDSSTVAVLDDLDTLANFNAVYIGTDIVPNGFNFTLINFNDNASVMAVHYNNGAWTAVSGFSDGTDVSGDTLKQSGTVSYTAPTDCIPNFMFGKNLFWTRITFSAQLDAAVTISECTYESTFQPIQNMWDGVLVDAIEGVVEDGSTSTMSLFSGVAITLDVMVAQDGSSGDWLYFNSLDPLIGIYIVPGSTPNTTRNTTLYKLEYFNGDTWEDASATDNTRGLANPGYITWTKPTDEQPRQFETSLYYSHWYRIGFDKTLSADIVVGIRTMPNFDIDKMGKMGNVNSAWKEHMVYTSSESPNQILISPKGRPMVLNGYDYEPMEAGDGRSNPILAMKNYFNELLVWQKEIGVAGGCVTIFEGNESGRYGKLVISTKHGILNSKCAVVIEGIKSGTVTDVKHETLAFWISESGVKMLNGLTIISISNDINNYFDPTHADCIRKGYEDKHWLFHSSRERILVLGLVNGSSTVPNVFLQYDYVDALNMSTPGVFKGWSHRTLGQGLSCMLEIEAASGDINVLQVGGGSSTGKNYQCNVTDSDVTTAIDAHTIQEFSGGGSKMRFRHEIHTCKAQAVGNFTRTYALNGNTSFTGSKTFAMQAETANDTYRRNRGDLAVNSHHVSIKLQNNVVDEILYLEATGYKIDRSTAKA